MAGRTRSRNRLSKLLRAYLDEAARLLADDPDYLEILADLEQAIGDKGSRCLGSGKNVLGEAEMKRILEEMGPVETDFQATDAGARQRALRRARPRVRNAFTWSRKAR